MDHDQRLKLLLEAFFAEFVRLALPDWVGRFDFANAEWLPQEVFPDPPQGERRAVDLVARLPVHQPLPGTGRGDAGAMVTLIHVEVESADSVAKLRQRMHDYRNHLQGKYGTPVLPIALYMKVGLEGIGWDVYEEWYWEHRLVHFEYPYVGLPALDAMQHVHGENILAAALAVLMRVSPERRAELKAEAMLRAASAAVDAYRRYLLAECVEAYLSLEQPHLDQFNQLLLTPKYQEAKMIGQTSYEKGLEQGKRRLVAMLRRQLERKFGPLDEAAQKRLEQLPDDKFDKLADDVLFAESLKDLGLKD